MHTYISYETAKLVSDKQYMKDIFIKNGIMTSRYVILDKYDEDEVRKLTFPLIVKPVDAYSSKGVSRCNSLSEVEEHLAEAIEISRTKTAIVEEFKEGTELTVYPVGKLDTVTTPLLEAVVSESLDGVESVVIDMPAMTVSVNVLAVICSPTRSLTLKV